MYFSWFLFDESKCRVSMWSSVKLERCKKCFFLMNLLPTEFAYYFKLHTILVSLLNQTSKKIWNHHITSQLDNQVVTIDKQIKKANNLASYWIHTKRISHITHKKRRRSRNKIFFRWLEQPFQISMCDSSQS